jgi:hypothetical protein
MVELLSPINIKVILSLELLLPYITNRTIPSNIQSAANINILFLETPQSQS